MAARQRRTPPDIGAVVGPDFHRLVVAPDTALGAPQQQHRAFDLAAGGDIGGIHREVDAEGGAVVLAHAVPGRRILEAADVFRERLGREEFEAVRPLAELFADVEFGIGAHHPLRQVEGLRHEEPVPGDQAPGAGDMGQQMMRRHDVDQRRARDLVRVIEAHPVQHARAALIDIMPTHHLLTHVTRAWGLFSWHWFFMAQPFDLPERMMGADPEFYIRKKLGKGPDGLEFFAPEALAEYIRCFKNPATRHGMCEDYRATSGIDLAMDAAAVAAARKVECPVLLLWGAKGGVGRNHKPMEVWADYCADIRRGAALPSGHYVPDEAPEETAEELKAFFTT